MPDLGVANRSAHEDRMRLARQFNIVGKFTLAGEQRWILDAQAICGSAETELIACYHVIPVTEYRAAACQA